MAAALVALGLWVTPSVPAGVRSDTVYRTYWVQGTTPRSLVGYMQRNPFPGDHGGAYANIRPSYDLDFDLVRKGGICRAQDVDLEITFVITLPAARDEARMSAKSRATWQAFVGFARRHEEQHRVSYLDCGRAIAQQVRAARAGTCTALRSEINQILAEAKRACEARQVAFDREQKTTLAGQGLFRSAGY